VLLLRPGLLKVAAGVGVGLFAAAALAGGVYITLEIIGS
jgi:hypothetical protein